LRVAEHDGRFVIFLRRQHADVAPIAQTGKQRLIGQHVELLHRFALNVGRSRAADDVDQAGTPDLSRHDLGCQRNSGKQPRKIAAGVRMVPLLLLLDVLLCGEKDIRLEDGRGP
jgi:hypothetical protein